MIRIKVLISAVMGTFVYVFVSLVAGNNGILGYNKLVEQKKEIARQTDSIQSINNELNLEYTALLRDKDVIAAFARKLDYVGPGEKLVKINGLKPSESALFDTGTVLRRKEISYIPERTCKIAGFSFFFLTFTLLLLIDISNGKLSVQYKKEAFIQGIPVYDLQQI